ncbi:MAG: hypothetical protein M4579_004617 [Chaenotheca gracillima]|nr:MAG: hypothetical protein M4579_004617 [Chaenotheca gracillima]
MAVGNLAKGSSLNVVPMPGGTLVSEPGFEPKVDAEWVYGADFIHGDPSGKTLISFTYTGHIAINEATGAVFTGSPDAKTTDFGDAFTHIEMETGAEHLKGLELGQFVSSGRFIVEKGKPVVVEYKISQVVKG